MNLEKILNNYGLTQKQAKIYLACLELGSASVTKISQKAGLARSTSYEVLESLQQQKLISTFRKKNVQYFSAEEPQKAINIAKEKAELLEQALPQLRAIQGISVMKPSVRFYQGKEEMKIILNEILEEADKLLSFGSSDDVFSVLSDYFPKFIEQRVKKKIPIRGITFESVKARERKQIANQILMKIKVIPKEYQHNGLTFIWKNKVAMFSFKKDLTALVIESEELMKIQKSMFDFMWDNSE